MVWKVIIVSALSLSLRNKDRFRDREIEKAWQFWSFFTTTNQHPLLPSTAAINCRQPPPATINTPHCHNQPPLPPTIAIGEPRFPNTIFSPNRPLNCCFYEWANEANGESADFVCLVFFVIISFFNLGILLEGLKNYYIIKSNKFEIITLKDFM